MLYDATLCTGCKACVDSCVTVNGLKLDTHLDGLHMEPMFLNAQTKNIIELCKATPEHQESFVKLQCMHCGDPACVAACPFEALEKHLTTGIVEWKADTSPLQVHLMGDTEPGTKLSEAVRAAIPELMDMITIEI